MLRNFEKVNLIQGVKLFLTFVVAAGWACHGFAADPLERTPQPRVDIYDVLRAEAKGDLKNRANLLTGNMARSKQKEAAHWHAGEVRVGRDWVKYDQLPTSESDQAVRAEYQALRRETSPSGDSLLSLADWCRDHDLPEQERAHLLESLNYGTQSPKTLTRLGYRPVGGVWLDPQELELLDAERKTRAAAVKKWQTRLLRIRDNLNSSSARRQNLASRRLMSITEPEVVYAMEELLCGGTEAVELAVIKALGELSSFQAAHALVALAVESNNLHIRKAATEELKSKPRQDTVPELLGRMTTPMQTRIVSRYRDGFTFIRQIYYRERQYQRPVSVVDTTIRTTRHTNPNIDYQTNQRYYLEYARQQQETSRRINEQAAQNNERVYAVLASVTEANVTNTPQAWWEWWNKEQDTEVIEKPFEYQYEEGYEERLALPVPRSCECFRAGTPVWTDEGFKPIETIRTGDRVLSKNVETGELAYQLVLEPTQRDPEELRTVMLEGGESFVCTGGHPFWRSGEGWKMAKDLKPGDLLHTVTGTHKVQAVSGGAAEKVYNLIVDKFNTYFVGKSMTLSHDNSIRKPTNAVVPGLTRDELTAK